MHQNVLANIIFRLWSERQPDLEIKKPTIGFFLFLEQVFLYNDNYPIMTTVAFYPIIINICGPSKNMCICVTLLGHAGEKKNMQKPVNDVESKPKRPTKYEMPKKKCSFSSCSSCLCPVKQICLASSSAKPANPNRT